LPARPRSTGPAPRPTGDALAERNPNTYAERIAGRPAVIPAENWQAVVDAVLDECLAVKRSMPGFALADFGSPSPGGDPGGDPGGQANRRVAGRPSCSPAVVAETRVLLGAHLARVLD
jgi:hypothetical protein